MLVPFTLRVQWSLPFRISKALPAVRCCLKTNLGLHSSIVPLFIAVRSQDGRTRLHRQPFAARCFLGHSSKSFHGRWGSRPGGRAFRRIFPRPIYALPPASPPARRGDCEPPSMHGAAPAAYLSHQLLLSAPPDTHRPTASSTPTPDAPAHQIRNAPKALPCS
eukprot:GHVT01088402.1.p1 GENE.GHVT01088402.1~~GHVT01088402.1.p1  ORF type:complete len:163 (+),score=14.88 GHVT01088402.1:105-593(+)